MLYSYSSMRREYSNTSKHLELEVLVDHCIKINLEVNYYNSTDIVGQAQAWGIYTLHKLALKIFLFSKTVKMYKFLSFLFSKKYIQNFVALVSL